MKYYIGKKKPDFPGGLFPFKSATVEVVSPLMESEEEALQLGQKMRTEDPENFYFTVKIEKETLE